MNRRRLLVLAGLVASTGVAGCLSDGDEADDSEDSDDTDNEVNEVNGDNGDPDGTDGPSGTDDLVTQFVDTSSPETIVASWYGFDDETTEGLSEDERFTVVDAMLHSRSPLVDLFQALEDVDDTEEGEEESEDVEIESFELEVVEENLGEGELEEELTPLAAVFGLDEETVAELTTALAEENAVVRADVTQTGADVTDETEVVTEYWLVAPENDNWLLFSILVR